MFDLKHEPSLGHEQFMIDLTVNAGTQWSRSPDKLLIIELPRFEPLQLDLPANLDSKIVLKPLFSPKIMTEVFFTINDKRVEVTLSPNLATLELNI